MRSLSIVSLTFVFCGMLLLSGCGESVNHSTSQEAQSSKAAHSGAFCSTGASLVGDCIVTYYKPDGTYYVTEQYHKLCPAKGRITITAKEPAGAITWALSGSEFTVQPKQYNKGELCNAAIARVLLTTLAIGTQSGIDGSMTALSNTKIDGQWYKPFEFEGPEKFSQTIYENTDTSIPELVDLQHNSTTLRARSYNYIWSEQMGKNIPEKIDVFSIEKVNSEPVKIMEVYYTTLKTQ